MTPVADSLSPATVAEIVESAFHVDALAADEYMETFHRHGPFEPEKQLMFAILHDAIRSYRKYVLAQASANRRLFHDAEKWIWLNDWDWPFSFCNICDALGLDPYFLRRCLLRWKASEEGGVRETQGTPCCEGKRTVRNVDQRKTDRCIRESINRHG